MYIGRTDLQGLTHLIWELLSNSVDQVLAGNACRVEIVLHPDDSVEVIDDGPGINLLDDDVHSYFTTMHDSPTADSHSPHIHVGMGGLGLVIPNALSSRFEVVTRFGNQTLRCQWLDGTATGGEREILDQEWIGTSVRMWPDGGIFDEVTIQSGSLDRRVHELNALISGLILSVTDLRPPQSWESGMLTLLSSTRQNGRRTIGEPSFVSLHDETSKGPIELRVCLAATRHSHDEHIVAFCNFDPVTADLGFVSALRASIWEVAAAELGGSVPPSPETFPIRSLAAVASIIMLAPQWGGPSKSHITDPRALAAAQRLIRDQLPGLIEESASLRTMLTSALDDIKRPSRINPVLSRGWRQ